MSDDILQVVAPTASMTIKVRTKTTLKGNKTKDLRIRTPIPISSVLAILYLCFLDA